MKLTAIATITAFLMSSPFAFAQSDPGGPGTPRPAATSASPKGPSYDTTGMAPNRSGSGTSTSGGSDANGDQGRDKMPDSSIGVRPYDKQNKPSK